MKKPSDFSDMYILQATYLSNINKSLFIRYEYYTLLYLGMEIYASLICPLSEMLLIDFTQGYECVVQMEEP
jgi:hypothetical protein